MADIFPKLCMECKHSKQDRQSSWSHGCFHPKVIMNDEWALANNNEGKPCGVTCSEERRRRSWFAPCGMKGKLFTPK